MGSRSEMKELLEKAYRDYPIGTKFICKYDDNIREVQPYEKNKTVTYCIQGDIIRCDNGMFCKNLDGSGTCSNPAMYENGEWVIIISDEPKYEIY